jgi:hypothetical protein
MIQCCTCGYRNEDSANKCSNCGGVLIRGKSIGTKGEMVGGPRSQAQIDKREEERREKAQSVKKEIGQEAQG